MQDHPNIVAVNLNDLVSSPVPFAFSFSTTDKVTSWKELSESQGCIKLFPVQKSVKRICNKGK